MFARLMHTAKRVNTLLTHRISALPIAILMPHSACNCRCVMCDIWKGNQDRKQLHRSDIEELLSSFRQLDTRRVVMSGGEALLNANFFTYCALLREAGIKVTLLSTGLTIERHAADICREVDELIVSLDGDPTVHDRIRNVPGAYARMETGIRAIRSLRPKMRVSGRCVIHRLNYLVWPDIVSTARQMTLDSISFLPADVTSEAFNREQPWDKDRQQSVLVPREELPALASALEIVLRDHYSDIAGGFILESEEKLRRIIQYYQAHHGLADFPSKKCNAPWVSAVVEADGSVRPCFFHDRIGNVRDGALHELINTPAQVAYRRTLDVTRNDTCRKCVCYLRLPATAQVT